MIRIIQPWKDITGRSYRRSALKDRNGGLTASSASVESCALCSLPGSCQDGHLYCDFAENRVWPLDQADRAYSGVKIQAVQPGCETCPEILGLGLFKAAFSRLNRC